MLGRMIECFQRQTYQNRELLILDDGGQYPLQPSGDRWRIVSQGQRYDSLGEKRRAAIDMIDADAIAIWDDDDIYFPWALAAQVHGLKTHLWLQSREVFEWDGREMTRIVTFKPHQPTLSHHASWAYRRDIYHAAGGYIKHDEDNQLQYRLLSQFGTSGNAQSPEFPEPYYVYSRETETAHISNYYHTMGHAGAWCHLDSQLRPATIHVGWDRDYLAIPRPTVSQPRPW